MTHLASCVSLLIECDFCVNRVILSDFRIFPCLPVRKNRRLHTTKTTVNVTKPNNHPITALLTSILDESEDRGPYYASFSQKRRNVTFLPSEITHFCHRRPMFQIQQRRSDTNADTASFATKPEFTSCPLIGQSPSWRTATMVPIQVRTRQCRFRTLTPHGEV